jgi:hypothetical protein
MKNKNLTRDELADELATQIKQFNNHIHLLETVEDMFDVIGLNSADIQRIVSAVKKDESDALGKMIDDTMKNR